MFAQFKKKIENKIKKNVILTIIYNYDELYV